MRPEGRSVDSEEAKLFPAGENTDALADLAVDNFIEMRDKTASRPFRAKKKLDHLLEGRINAMDIARRCCRSLCRHVQLLGLIRSLALRNIQLFFEGNQA
jgi:hypothetical protein